MFVRQRRGVRNKTKIYHKRRCVRAFVVLKKDNYEFNHKELLTGGGESCFFFMKQ
jgi:hypothetical protein